MRNLIPKKVSKNAALVAKFAAKAAFTAAFAITSVFGGFAAFVPAQTAYAIAPATASWNTTGSYAFAFKLAGDSTEYPHQVNLVQDESGAVSGGGTSGAYAWTIDSGSVSGDTIAFTAHYTASEDAANPLTTMHVSGLIAPDGMMSGSWDDNYNEGSRAGTWMTTSGNAAAIPPAPASDTTAPSLPVHLSPENNSTTTTAALVVLDWTDSEEASSTPVTYDYEIANDPTITGNGSFVAPVYSSVESQSSHAAAGTPAGVYFWHVRAIDSASNKSAWTDAWRITVDNTPAPGPVFIDSNTNGSYDSGEQSFATIQDAVTAANPGDTIRVSGIQDVSSQINIAKPDLSIVGNSGAKITTSGSFGNIFFVTASGFRLEGFEIEKTDKATQQLIGVQGSGFVLKNNVIHGQFVIGDGDVTRALVISGGLTGLNIEGNTIYSLLQPAYVTGTTTGTVMNNVVYNTKGWVLEGGNLTFTGNSWGDNLDPLQPNVVDIAILATMPATFYTDTAALSAANNGATIDDQRQPHATTTKVTIAKFVNDAQATAATSSANGAEFPMVATWNASNIGAGTGNYSIGPVGFGTDAAYQAQTIAMTSGGSYSSNEITGGSVVGASCAEGKPFALQGYSTGDTMMKAMNHAATTTVPAFTNMTSDKFIIVRNITCAPIAPSDTTAPAITNISSAVSTSTATVTWTTDEAASSMIEYGTTAAYGTTATSSPAFSTSHSIMLSGLTASTTYHFRVTSADAAMNSASSSDQTFTTSATATSTGQGTLATTGITSVSTFATPDNDYAHGFRWIFHVTIPTNENAVSMKFADLVSGSNVIPASGNIRYYSAQSTNASASTTAITVTASSTYATPDMNIQTDLDSGTPGIQADITVEAKIPENTPGGTYSTTYGIRSRAGIFGSL